MIRLLRAELLAAGQGTVELVEGNILDMDIGALARPAASMVVLGNLPYNISSQVLVRLVEHRNAIDRAVLDVSKKNWPNGSRPRPAGGITAG